MVVKLSSVVQLSSAIGSVLQRTLKRAERDIQARSVMLVFLVLFIVFILRFIVFTLTMFNLVSRHVDAVIPVVRYKVNPSSTRFVFLTMRFPMLSVDGLDPEVNWLFDHQYALNDNGFGVDQAWLRIIADVDLAIKTRLTQRNRYCDIGS